MQALKFRKGIVSSVIDIVSNGEILQGTIYNIWERMSREELRIKNCYIVELLNC